MISNRDFTVCSVFACTTIQNHWKVCEEVINWAIAFNTCILSMCPERLKIGVLN